MRLLLFKGLLLAAAVFVGLAGWLAVDFRTFLARPITIGGAEQIYSVAPGVSMRALAEDLAREGIIDRPRYLAWLARWRDQAHRLQAGEYALSPTLTPGQLLDLFVSGKVLQHSLTVVEGWTFAQLIQAIERHAALQHSLQGLDAAQIMARLGQPGEHPEGRFLPDTYSFPRGTSDLQFLQRAQRAMQELLLAEWERRAEGLPLASPDEVLILASIIEKETAVAEERGQIAGVFVRRLQRNMRLQTDPTVIYGLGEAFDGNLTRDHLRRDTPYNTYTRHGLPPTPICLPGADSLRAALDPAPGDALYFVARGDGSHAFSATLDQHNRAVVQYQLSGQRGASRPPAVE